MVDDLVASKHLDGIERRDVTSLLRLEIRLTISGTGTWCFGSDESAATSALIRNDLLFGLIKPVACRSIAWSATSPLDAFQVDLCRPLSSSASNVNDSNDMIAFVDREEHAINVRTAPEIEHPNRLIWVETLSRYRAPLRVQVQ